MKYRFVFTLELLNLALFSFLFIPFLMFSSSLYYYILTIFFLAEVFFLFRGIEFTDKGVLIRFYFNFFHSKNVISYDNISKVTYKFGQYGGMSVIIFRESKKSRFNHFFVNRFVLERKENAVLLLRFLKGKGVNIELDSPDIKVKKKLLKLIDKNA